MQTSLPIPAKMQQFKHWSQRTSFVFMTIVGLSYIPLWQYAKVKTDPTYDQYHGCQSVNTGTKQHWHCYW